MQVNRIIKFRAWDKQNKQMVKIWGANWKDWDSEQLLSFFAVNPVINGEYILKIENAEMMQYTGYTDKHDTDIYEGDKVLCFLNGAVIGADDTIVFKHGAFWLDRRNRPLYEWFELEEGEGAIEVTGNIYEHQELLK